MTTVIPSPPVPVTDAAPPGPAAAPPDSRYDQLARTPSRRWYHPLAGLVTFVVVFLLVAVPVFVVGLLVADAVGVPVGADGALLDDAWSSALSLLVVIAALPAVLVAVRFAERRRPGALSSVTGHLRLRWLGVCLLPALGITVVVVAVAEIVEPTAEPLVGWPVFLAVVVPTLLLTPLQAAAEEYVFRGWLVQAVGTVVRGPWLGVLVSAILFALVHDGAATNPWGFADLVVFAGLLAFVTIRTGGLEAAIALHVVHNAVISVGAAAYGVMESSADYSAMEPVAPAITAGSLAAYAAVVLVLARRRGIATRSAPAVT